MESKKKGCIRRQNVATKLFHLNDMQMYTHLFIGGIPTTRIISYRQFKTQSQGKIKDYILYLLESYPNGLDTRQISDVSDIWVQSLTNPIKSLLDDGLIQISSIHKSSVSNRMVQVYSLVKNG
jgi:hypothetical protein